MNRKLIEVKSLLIIFTLLISSIRLPGQKNTELHFYPLYELENAINRLKNSDSLYFTIKQFSKIENTLKKKKKPDVLKLYTEMVCPICNGLTEVRSDRINNCAICVGSGKVKRWVDGFGNQYLFQPPNIWVSEQWVTCFNCKGNAGSISPDVKITCPFCLGNGTIYFINKLLKINTEIDEISADFTKHEQKKINSPITIGDKEWMSENLSTELYANGDSIPQARDSIEWKRFNEMGIGCWCFYDFNSVYEEKFYNWYAVNNSRGLAPEGWQVASDAEWIELISIFGGKEKAGKKIKSTVGWDDKLNGSNTSGLNVSPYGSCNSSGSFSGIGHLGDFWTSTQYDINYAFSINVTSVSFIEKTFDFKSAGKSVRCIRDHP